MSSGFGMNPNQGFNQPNQGFNQPNQTLNPGQNPQVPLFPQQLNNITNLISSPLGQMGLQMTKKLEI